MNDIQTALLYQTLSYGAVLLLSIMFFSFLLRGFFWKFLKVKMSMGRLILIKCRTPVRDFFYIGEIEKGFLIFKFKEENRKHVGRISIDTSKFTPFYKCLGVLWVDINEEKSAIMLHDYTAVSGFDVRKYSDLLLKALQQPTIQSNREKIIIGLLIVVILVLIAIGILGFYNYDISNFIKGELPNVCKGIVQAQVTGTN
jgi:hypothetical protein